MKKCSRCGEVKAFDLFYKDRSKQGGFSGTCKECVKKYRQKVRIKIAEYGSEYYQNNKERMLAYQRKWREANPQKRAAYPKRYKVQLSESNKKYYQENREKVNTHNAVGHAIKQGKLVRPDECSICAKKGKIEGHHHDYSKPLDVVWLCTSCHRTIHSGVTIEAEKTREALNGIIEG